MARAPCTVEGCNSPRVGRGLCSKHWQRWRKSGDPLACEFSQSSPGQPLAFLTKAIATDTEECIHWPYMVSKSGYAKMHYKGRQTHVSRIVCEIAYGPPPTPSHEAAHNCGKGHEACINHRHLQWKTKLENEADKRRHGTILDGTKHNMVKLAENQVQEIRTLSHLSAPKIGRLYGVSTQTVYDIRWSRTWKCLG